MKSFSLGLGIVIASLSLATPALAQRPESGGASTGTAVDRSSGTGAASSAGSAVDRGSGGNVAGSSSTTISSGDSGGGFSSPSASAASSPSISFGDRAVREAAPQHRMSYGARAEYTAFDDDQRATPRASGPSGGGSGTAVTRGGGSAGESSAPGARCGSGDGNGAMRGTGRTRTAPAPENASGSNNASGAREVPSWSRPRGDRPVTGTAVDRTTPPPDRNGRNGYGYGYGSGLYDPYGYGFGYGYPGYGYYNSYYYPYGFGMGYGLYPGFGWAPYFGDPYGDPYGGYGYGGGYATSYGRGEQGNLKLKVKPRSAKVYVDGYFVGLVDQFDGIFEKLALNTGRHKVEIKADGFETAEFDVLINPQQTVTFQGELKRIQ
jgi:hypothetical protein